MVDQVTKLQNTNEKDKAIEAILEFLPTEVEIPVLPPSNNRFYTLKDPSKPITVRPMTYEDERVAAKAKASSGDILTILLDRCVTNINVNDLFIFDKVYMLLKLREATYGRDFETKVTCEKCGQNSEVKFDLTKVNVTSLPEEVSDPHVFELPVIKKEAAIRFPRIKDEIYLQGDEDHIGKNIWRFVASIDKNTDPYIISKVIEKLPIQDMHRIVKEISGSNWGIDPKANFPCSHCNEEYEISLPLGENFFYMS
jgi:hypothetical protein